MFHRFVVALLAIGLIGLTSGMSVDEKKDPEKKDTETKEAPKAPVKEPVHKEKLGAGGTLVGKLIKVESAQRYLTLEISQQLPGQGGGGPAVNIGKGRQIHAPGMQMKEVKQKVELQAADDLKVRMKDPPVNVDEKGRHKKYTPKELKELKGSDPKLPGYAADFDSLKADQTVQVYLAKPKTGAKAVRAKTKDADTDLPADKPEVTLIVILHEPPK